jgi:peptidyl-prolyl cis-trans isomerase A (cyclophilin A)
MFKDFIRWRKQVVLFLFFLIIGGAAVKLYAGEQEVHIRIVTELGNIEAALYPEKAPITVANFLANIDAGVYKNGHFYRSARPDNQFDNQFDNQSDNQPDGPNLPMTLIQGGRSEDTQARSAIVHETTQISGLSHQRAVISMARYKPGTASSEFFICLGDNTRLDYINAKRPGYAAFGRVTQGLSVAEQIAVGKTGSRQLTAYENSMAPNQLRPQLLNKSIRIFDIQRMNKQHTDDNKGNQ